MYLFFLYKLFKYLIRHIITCFIIFLVLIISGGRFWLYLEGVVNCISVYFSSHYFFLVFIVLIFLIFFLKFISFLLTKFFIPTILILIKYFKIILINFSKFVTKFANTYFNLLIFFLLAYLIIFLLLCFILFFLKFNLYFVILQEFISFIILIPIIFFINKFFYNKVVRFIYYYSILEGISTIIFFISYLINFNEFYFIFLIFKLGGFPFLYYKYFILGSPINYLFFRILFFIYLTISKAIIYVNYSLIPINSFIIIIFILVFCIFILIFSFLRYDIFNFVLNSIIFNNLIFLILIPISNYSSIFFYVFVTNFFQFKVLLLLKKRNISSLKLSYLLLIFLNGGPIFLFNWVKILFLYSIFNFNFFIFFIIILCNSFFLVKSFYYFFIIFFKNVNFNYFFIFTYIINLILLFFLFLIFCIRKFYFDFFIYSFNSSSINSGNFGYIDERKLEELEWERSKKLIFEFHVFYTPWWTDYVGLLPIIVSLTPPYWFTWHPGIIKHVGKVNVEELDKEKLIERVIWVLEWGKFPQKIWEDSKDLLQELWYRRWLMGEVDQHIKFDENGEPLGSDFHISAFVDESKPKSLWEPFYKVGWVLLKELGSLISWGTSWFW